MKFYSRQPDEIPGVLNRCYFDADHGRVALGLARLKELGDEFPDNAHVAYAEGQIRRDYLGQGLAARQLFERAHDLALTQHLKTETQWFSTCNLVQLASTEVELRRWIEIAYSEKGKSQPECVMFAGLLKELADGVPLHEMVAQAAVETGNSGQAGLAAALMDIWIRAWRCPTASDELTLRKQRAMSLRQLDMAASQRREGLGEAFPPDERLALQSAFEELERAIALDEYDPALWNYGSAWCVLLRRYDDAVRFADRAIALRPHHYPRPFINKAQALWELKRHQEALECARTGLAEAEGSELPPDVSVQSRTLIQMYEAGPVSPKLDAMRDVFGRIVVSARRISDEELGQLGSGVSLETIVNRLLNHVSTVQQNPIKGYVPMMADLLACFSAETALCASVEAYKRNGKVAEYCVSAALYVASHAEGAHQKDAARYLCLMTIFLLDGQAIRRYYRQAFLATSAAAQGPMANLDAIVREELGHINQLFPTLIADQEPATSEERQTAMRDVLCHFEGDPPAVSHANRAGPGCAAMAICLLGVLLFGVVLLLGNVCWPKGKEIDNGHFRFSERR